VKNAVASACVVVAQPSAVLAVEKEKPDADSLFEHVAWLYAFFRERLFRDDSSRIITALWPSGRPKHNTRLLELGCGPGFYSRRLAKEFSELSVLGVDRCESQLCRARERALAQGLQNCRFEHVNVHGLSCGDSEFDVVLASRLFTVLTRQQRAVAEIYRVLRPGGRCFIAEPRYAFWASIPLVLLWLLARALHFRNGYREPHKARIYTTDDFKALFATQPWRRINVWRDGRYQYVVCEK
jgi:arsenite methyltransferase